jgi:hypothetical protein
MPNQCPGAHVAGDCAPGRWRRPLPAAFIMSAALQAGARERLAASFSLACKLRPTRDSSAPAAYWRAKPESPEADLPGLLDPQSPGAVKSRPRWPFQQPTLGTGGRTAPNRPLANAFLLAFPLGRETMGDDQPKNPARRARLSLDRKAGRR